MGRMVPVPVIALVIGSLLVTAALVTLLYGTYHVALTSEVDINGATQEYCQLKYDGTLITTALDEQNIPITDSSPPTLNSGDSFSDVHTWTNDDDVRDYQIIIDDTTMPDMSTTSSLWYGVELTYLDGSDVEITKIDLDALSSKDIKYHYEIDELFEDPGATLFPFSLNFEINEMLWRYLTVGTTGDGTATIDTVSLSVDDATRFDNGTSVQVTATPDNGDISFSGWTGDVTSTDNPISIVMDADYSIVANFIENLIASSFGFGGHNTGGHVILHDAYEVYDSTDTLLFSAGTTSSEWTEQIGTATFNVDNIDAVVDPRYVATAFCTPSVITEFEGLNDAYVQTTIEITPDANVNGGIIFNYDSDSDYYLFRIMENAASNYASAIEHWDGSSWTSIDSDVTQTWADGAENTLKLVHDSSGTYDAYLNGVLVMENVACP